MKKDQGGYILALNIAVLALMLVGATYMGQRMSVAITLAEAEKQRVSDEYTLESARAEVMFMLATVPRTKLGLGSLATFVQLDGRYYQLNKDVLVSFQDMRGLLSVNAIRLDGLWRERLERLIGTYGIDPDAASALTDTLLDYRDADDLKRLNGAEKDDYRYAGLDEKQIRNHDLLSPQELSRVLHWNEYPALWGDDPISDHVSITRRSMFNPNTANWRALMAMSNIPEELAKSLVNMRQSSELSDISSLAYTGGVGNPFGQNAAVNLYPDKTTIITLRLAKAAWGVRLVMSVEPGMKMTPWRISSVSTIPLDPLSSADQKTIRALPELSLLRDPSIPLKVQSPF